MTGITRQRFTGPLAETAEQFAKFLKRHSLDFERFAAHLRLDILTPREAWALRRICAISGGGDFALDLKHALVTPELATITPRTATASVTGTAVDMNDCDGPCFGILLVGAVSGTSPTLNVKYQDCPTSSGTFADVNTWSAVHPQVTAASQSSRVNFKRNQRWVRALATIGGASPSFAFACVLEGQLKVR